MLSHDPIVQRRLANLDRLSLPRDVIWARAFMRALREAEEQQDQTRLRGMGVVWEVAAGPAERAELAACWRAGDPR